MIDDVHYTWPNNLPSPPYPSHLQAFIYACIEVESQENEQQSKLRQRQQQAQGTRHPKSKFG